MPRRSLRLGVLGEAEFTTQVLGLAKAFGWRRAHFRPARTAHGWRTAVQGDGVGFPDLVLVRRGRIVVAELKTENGRLSPEQVLWLEAFRLTRLVEVYEWRPSQWPSIEETLR